MDHNFAPSPTDTKLLIALTQELTVAEAARIAGIPHEYSRKRISLLKKKGYLNSRAMGSMIYYSTIRMPETTEHFAVGGIANGSKDEISVPFYGEMLTFPQMLSKVATSSKKLNSNITKLYSLTGHILATLQVRSYKKSLKQPTQPPDEDTLRKLLIQYINHTEMELKLAKELLNCRILWSGSTGVWQMISTNTPTDRTVMQYKFMFDHFAKG